MRGNTEGASCVMRVKEEDEVSSEAFHECNNHERPLWDTKEKHL